MAKPKDKAGLKLVTAEAQDVEKQFRELYDRANKHSPGAGLAAERLRKLLTDNPTTKLWERIPGPMKAAEEFAFDQSPLLTPGVRVCWRVQLADIRRELAGENPSEVESLLAQHAALCWLRLAEVELLHTAKLAPSHTLTLGAYYDKRLTMAQRRFTKACEMLERIHMMKRRVGQIGEAAAAVKKRA